MHNWGEYLNQFGYAPNSLPAGFYDTNLKTDSSFEPSGVGAEKLFAQSEIAVGSGNAIGVMSGIDPTYRLWIGNPDPASAAFSVDKNGVLTATGAVIKGNITIGGSGNVNGTETIKDSSGNTLFVFDNNGINLWNTGGSNNGLNIYNGTPGTLVGNVQYVGSSVIFSSLASTPIAIISADNISLQAGARTITMHHGADINYDAGGSRHTFTDNINLQNSYNIDGCSTLSVATVNGGAINGSSLSISGSKSSIVPTIDGWKKVQAAEAPEGWFFDFASDIKHIDSRFLEVTQGEIRTVTTDQGDILVFRKRKDTRWYKNIRFQKARQPKKKV